MTNEAALLALTECREIIDEVDRRIIALLNERTLTVERIGRIKREAALPIYEPKREDQVFLNIAAHNAGPLSPDAAKRIFERIIDEMRKIQRDKMAFQEKDESC
jgi:chorismate mutase